MTLARTPRSPRGALSAISALFRGAHRRWRDSPRLRLSVYRWSGTGLVLSLGTGISAGALGAHLGLGLGIAALWWLATTSCLLATLSLLRSHPEGSPVETLGVPNGATMLRAYLAVPLILLAALPALALARPLFLAVAAPLATLDAIDGVLARGKGPVTVLGRALDPLMDTIFFSCCTLASLLLGFIPVWLALLILARYGLPALGFLLLYPWLPRRPALVATVFGKVNTVASALTVGISALLVLAGGPATEFDIALGAVLALTALGHLVVLGRRAVLAAKAGARV